MGKKEIERKLQRARRDELHYERLAKEREDLLKGKRLELRRTKKEINELEYGSKKSKLFLLFIIILFAAYLYFTYFRSN